MREAGFGVAGGRRESELDGGKVLEGRLGVTLRHGEARSRGRTASGVLNTAGPVVEDRQQGRLGSIRTVFATSIWTWQRDISWHCCCRTENSLRQACTSNVPQTGWILDRASKGRCWGREIGIVEANWGRSLRRANLPDLDPGGGMGLVFVWLGCVGYVASPSVSSEVRGRHLLAIPKSPRLRYLLRFRISGQRTGCARRGVCGYRTSRRPEFGKAGQVSDGLGSADEMHRLLGRTGEEAWFDE